MLNLKSHELRHIVRMIGDDKITQRIALMQRRFENDENLRTRLQFFLPPIVRLGDGKKIRTGAKFFLQGASRNLARGFHVRRRDEGNKALNWRNHKTEFKLPRRYPSKSTVACV